MSNFLLAIVMRVFFEIVASSACGGGHVIYKVCDVVAKNSFR